MDIVKLHQLFLETKAVSTDTRKISKDCMFFALKGENFDANTFAAEAIEKGAKYVVIDNPKYFTGDKTILVENTLTSLQKLATFHRNYLKTPIIALTGSNGKTTTKELINAVLSKKFNTKATLGNLNNHIGVPLTLLSFNKETEIGIVEMGANHQKEIEFLCEIAQPDYGYITNFGKAHLEGFGGIEGVIKGKSEMYHHLINNNKLLFYNSDDILQREKLMNYKNTYSFGVNNSVVDVKFQNVEANPFVTFIHNETRVQTNLIGLYNATNCMAAFTIGNYFKVEEDLIVKAISNYSPDNNRSQILHKNSNEIILDAYNANPSSMKAALENFLELKHDKKIIILGDMYELGIESKNEHASIINHLIDKNETTYLVGKEFFKNQIEHDFIKFFESYDDFGKFLKSQDFKNSMILIKGSRGMALERCLDLI